MEINIKEIGEMIKEKDKNVNDKNGNGPVVGDKANIANEINKEVNEKGKIML